MPAPVGNAASRNTRLQQWLKIDPLNRPKVYAQIYDATAFQASTNWLGIVFSAGIATFGLIQNSPARHHRSHADLSADGADHGNRSRTCHWRPLSRAQGNHEPDRQCGGLRGAVRGYRMVAAVPLSDSGNPFPDKVCDVAPSTSHTPGLNESISGAILYDETIRPRCGSVQSVKVYDGTIVTRS